MVENECDYARLNGISTVGLTQCRMMPDYLAVLRDSTCWPCHQSQPFRKLIPPRSRDHQSFLGPGHADVEEFHVLGGLGFRCADLAEADEDHGAEFEALAALHGEDVGEKYPVVAALCRAS